MRFPQRPSVAATVLTAALVLLLPACSGEGSGSGPVDALASYGQVAQEDREVLQSLVQKGAQLDERREVKHYLYFDDASSARQAAKKATAAKWQASVLEPDADITQWSVTAVDERVLTPDEVADATDFFEDLAKQFDGDYDGWEAAV